ncbi:LANO_0G03246g1_1 [Lachancea nothofagi CBS 11611]|uniref:LANO_0G03246g1_1 n=1 Tax=Lachancea nothofagi CBS 11611 TaxID=1266666 RepID=A0A1G4KFD6_9SACH|nr:LANO_0G03246g1_1 [Lachancea nothofagi CBS 11611]
MDDLLKVTDIVFAIASQLATKDYLSFRQINKNVYYDHLSGTNDDRIWASRLRLLGLQVVDDDKEINEAHLDAANIFSKVTTFTTGSAKTTYGLFYKQFQCFVDKLYHNELKTFFPPQYSEPLIHARILMNLTKYIPAEIRDYTQYRKLQENLGILRELFINTVIKEMDLSYERRDYDSAAEFVEVLSECHEDNTAADFFKSKNDFAADVTLPEHIFDPGTNQLIDQQLQTALDKIGNFLNSKIKLADKIFGDSYPVTLSYTENIIANNITAYFESQLTANFNSALAVTRIESMPFLYKSINLSLIENLVPSQNAGSRFKELFVEFFNLYLEPKILNYLDVSVQKFGLDLEEMFTKFHNDTTLKETQQNEQIYESLRAKTSKQQLIDEKNNFLTSFTKIFKISNNSKAEDDEQLQMAYNLNVMNNNLHNIEILVSLDLCYKVVQHCKTCIENMRTFLKIKNIEGVVKLKCQEAFKILITSLSRDHFKPGFQKAIEVLDQYDPNQMKNLQIELETMDSHVEPLIKFTELINTGDIVLQMISIFYKNELVQINIMDKNQDFLNDVVQVKKNFETMIDDYVANGLNIGINKLMDEVLFVFGSLQFPDDFNPDPKSIMAKEIKPSRAAIKNVELLFNHCFLLTGATDKGTIDIFQQEIGERFFNEIVKNIKKNLISSDGAIFLICDLNYYYDFIANTLKQKSIVPLFAGLKTVGQLYLVSGADSKELGKMICDLGRFQGVFTQDEIYELVQRRTDWVKVRRDVEKVMYGLGVSDCTLM